MCNWFGANVAAAYYQQRGGWRLPSPYEINIMQNIPQDSLPYVDPFVRSGTQDYYNFPYACGFVSGYSGGPCGTAYSECRVDWLWAGVHDTTSYWMFASSLPGRGCTGSMHGPWAFRAAGTVLIK